MRIKLTAVLCFMFIVNLPAASLAGWFSDNSNSDRAA